MKITRENIKIKYELISWIVEIRKANKEKTIIQLPKKALMAKEETRWDLVSNKKIWCKWNLSGENGLLPIESLYK